MKANGGSPVVAGRYRVHERIGAGGTATVLLAEDDVLRRRVAVKRLRSGGSEDERKRIVREARLGAALSHPGLATIFDVVDSDDETFAVMEFVDGRPLSELIGNDGLEPERVVDILRPVAAALDYAHGFGVVHRDVKPSNILIADDGTVKLVDLGAATSAEATRITAENNVVGTLAYLAPERLAGGDRSGREADIYSLGATAFEALSGSPPTSASTVAEAMAESAHGPPPDIRDRWPDATAGLAATLTRAMDPIPSRRQATAAQLVADIEATQLPPEPADTETRPLVAAAPGGRVGAGTRARAPWLAIAALAAMAVATIVAIALSGGGSAPSKGTAGAHARHASAGAGSRPGHQGGGGPAPAPPTTAATSTATSSSSQLTGAALGAQLNDQGYAMIQSGDYSGAVPVLRRAVAAFPRGTTDINYAYALFNLGHALRMSGDPAAAIPILEQRLQIPDQTSVVQQELDAARAAVGSTSGGTEPKPPKGGHGPPGLEKKPGGVPPGQLKKAPQNQGGDGGD
jgi:eukaryotic-like serine/threonine-protein kinase